jgi:hypothetical protein
MLNTFIKNTGTTKTIIHNNNKNNVNEIKWDADYDGSEANISLKLTNNGEREKYHFSLDNNDLANILNINSVDLPLEQRLKRDFKKASSLPKIIQIELENDDYNPIYQKQEQQENPLSIAEILSNQNPHISSPLANEEFIVPLSINDNLNNKYTLTPRKRHRKTKTHKTYKVYKHKKTSTRSKRAKTVPKKFFSLL